MHLFTKSGLLPTLSLWFIGQSIYILDLCVYRLIFDSFTFRFYKHTGNITAKQSNFGDPYQIVKCFTNKELTVCISILRRNLISTRTHCATTSMYISLFYSKVNWKEELWLKIEILLLLCVRNSAVTFQINPLQIRSKYKMRRHKNRWHPPTAHFYHMPGPYEVAVDCAWG